MIAAAPGRRRILAMAAVVLAAAGILLLYLRSQTAGASLTEYLPAEEGPVLTLDFQLLRRSGILERLAGPAGSEDPDYRQFVAGTGFDYRTDLDAAAIALPASGNYFVLRGRFSQDRLVSYVRASGGRCVEGACTVQGSAPGRLVSFKTLRRGLLGLAVHSKEEFAVNLLREGNRRPVPGKNSAVALRLPESALAPRMGWPPVVNLNLIALKGAAEAELWLGVGGQGATLSLRAPCPDEQTALAIATRLRGGEFRANGKSVQGRWPLPKGWVEALTGSTDSVRP